MMDLKPIYSKSITNEIVKRISEALQQREFKPSCLTVRFLLTVQRDRKSVV